MTWVLYTLAGFIWLVYAIQHKQRALIIAQTVCILADIAVVAGWMINTCMR